MTGEWQPIKTAPKDGTMILVWPSRAWIEECDKGEVVYWDVEEETWAGYGPLADDYTGPTHWMPLPEPPK